MTEFIHPNFYEYAYPVAVASARKYRDYVQAQDVRSDLIEWGYRNNTKVHEWLSEEDKKVLKSNIWILNKRLKKQAERYCRKMKAQSLGYHHTDEWFYNKGIIKELLPITMSGEWRDTLRGQPEGGRQPPREPSTGNNLPAMVVEIDRAIPKLSADQRKALTLLYVDELPLELAAMELSISEKALKARLDRAIERLVELTGGETPWDGIGSRKVMSNAQAIVQTARNE